MKTSLFTSLKTSLLGLAFGLALLTTPAQAQITFTGLQPSNAPPAVEMTLMPLPNTYPITNYFFYIGGSSGNYTNKIALGLNTNYILTNLTRGVAVYVNATQQDNTGLESAFYAETNYVPHTVPTGVVLGEKTLAP